jgi:hypothetical protein
MDALIAGNTFFNTSAALRTAAAKKNGLKDASGNLLPLPTERYRSFDYSSFSNADGYYSINNVEKLKQEKLWKNMGKAETPNKTTILDENTKSTREPPPDYSAVLASKEVKFKTKPNNNVRLIYTDRTYIQSKIKPEDSAKSILTNIDITVTVDGFSGFRAGECFNILGIPQIYNEIGMFQITNIKHNITAEGWVTILEASFRMGLNKGA